MLKTQITGAKYLSPQTNQMTNLNIAIPADSKDTEFGTSDILLAKDVVTYLNALDSDISKELDTQTDKINKINKSIKQLIDHNLIKIVTELPTTDIDKNCIYLVPNKDGEGNNIFIEYIYVESKNTFEEVGRIQTKVDLSDYYTKEETDNLILIAKNSAIDIHNEDYAKYITLDINDTEAAENAGSPVNVRLVDHDNNGNININAYGGFTHSSSDGWYSNLCYDGLDIGNTDCYTYINGNSITINGDSFKISRPNDTEGGVISGIKSLTAFANPSATKVWATDGSTVDLTTKANASDILLKQSTSGGYYIGSNDHTLGTGSFTTNSNCVAKGAYSHAEGSNTTANGLAAHAEGVVTHADGEYSHAEGNDTYANGLNSHAEGSYTTADGFAAHALGAHNVANINAIHSVGIGDFGHKKNAEYIYTKNKENGHGLTDDPKNGYKYLIGVGGYDGISTDNSKYKSILEVITDINSDLSTKANTSDLDAKANKSDVLLKKSADGGYYIEENSHELGWGAFATNSECTASGYLSYAEGGDTRATGATSHAEGHSTIARGDRSHAEGEYTVANGSCSHAEGEYTIASGSASHALGMYNVANELAIHSIGIGFYGSERKNSEWVFWDLDSPKNGYKYLIGVGGYDGISTDNSTYKSVQEVIADLTARIEQLETKVRALEAANTPA